MQPQKMALTGDQVMCGVRMLVQGLLSRCKAESIGSRWQKTGNSPEFTHIVCAPPILHAESLQKVYMCSFNPAHVTQLTAAAAHLPCGFKHENRHAHDCTGSYVHFCVLAR